MRVLRGVLTTAFALAFACGLPVSVAAETMSVSQTITITARVAPARSIVVNDQGKITKIYSNTSENVTPKVYLNNVPGEQKELTQNLLNQYSSIIADKDNLVGVEIPVEPPQATDDSVTKLLFGSISALTRQFNL